MDPERIRKSKDTLTHIDRACARLFFDEVEAEFCAECVDAGLCRSDYKKLREFKGKCSPRTFVHTVVNRLVIDCHRTRYGRFRPPKAVKALGPIAEEIYRLICLKGFSFEETYEVLLSKEKVKKGYEDFERCFRNLKDMECPKRLAAKPALRSMDSSNEHHASQEPDPLEAIIEKLDRERRIRAIRIIKEVNEGLSEEEKFLIRLLYVSGQSLSKTATATGLTVKSVKQQRDRLLLRYKAALLQAGIR